MMVTVLIEFYDKKTKFIADEKKIDIPYDLILAAAKDDDDGNLSDAIARNQQIDYFNCRPFEVTEDMKKYVIEHYTELKEKFDQYTYSFIGRHGLGPEYD
jgi:hypothetical protein